MPVLTAVLLVIYSPSGISRSGKHSPSRFVAGALSSSLAVTYLVLDRLTRQRPARKLILAIGDRT